ncbi:MAG: histone deacetylase, partial [Syntrophales bacterium]|nr:histone deacetylase [Syntrophales bacterium]
LDPDTSTTPYTYDTAKLAVGGLLNAVDAVMAGEADNAMAFIRPPGHHAGQSHAAGFCIFNNVAIAARYVMTKHKLERVLIVDWDLHHGDGTQALFYRDRRVLFFSTHQFPHYPGTGRITEIGMGEGLGYTINVPFSARTGNDMYIKAFRGLLQPVALKFKPEIILLSAGFDAYHQDPLGDMKVTAAGFAAMMRVLMDIADASCGGRIVATLEGGYHIGGVTESVRAVLMEMSDATRCPERDLQRWEAEADQGKDSTVRRVQEQINPIWQLF